MSAEWKMGQIAQGSPRCKARIAGFSYLLAVVAAVLGEFVIHGTLGLVLGLTAVACYVAVTLLMYVIFKPVSRVLCLFAVSFSLAGLILEALRWNPRGVDVAMVLHAAYCLLIGYLALRAAFLPRILGVPMMLAGFVWMTNLSPTLADSLLPTARLPVCLERQP